MTLDVAGGPRQALPHHLMLVTSDTPAPADVDAEGEPGEDDAAGPKHRRPEPAGTSATMRALMALGALAATLGLSNTQQALGSVLPGKHRPAAARRDSEALPKGPAPRIGTAVSEVVYVSSAVAAPTARPAVQESTRTVVAYTFPEGAGKHRKPAAACVESCGRTLAYIGKHRRTDSRSRYDRDRSARNTTGPRQAAQQTGPGTGHRRGVLRRSG